MTTAPRPSKGTDLIQPNSVADLAYERIRGLVLSGELAPGTRLGQVELAERFGISRTPVREALRRLAGEGLGDFHSNRGFRVAGLGLGAGVRRGAGGAGGWAGGRGGGVRRSGVGGAGARRGGQ